LNARSPRHIKRQIGPAGQLTVPKEETKTCHACRESLKWDWEVCPFCGASQENFHDEGMLARPPEGPLEPAEIIEYEPAENEQIDRPPPAPLRVAPLNIDSIPTDNVPYAVMRLGAQRINISELGRRLSAILGRPLADITCFIRSTKGFLARRVPQNKLRDVAGLIDELGIEAVAVAEEMVAPLPPIYRTAGVAPWDNGLTCAATSPADKTWRLTFSPDQVKLIVTGRVMYSAAITVEQPIYDPYKNISFLKKRYLKPEHSYREVRKEIHGYDYLIYAFLSPPERLLLITDCSVDYERMERRESRPDKMKHQARLIVETTNPSLHDEGLRLLADLDEDDPAWVPFTFATLRGIEAYAQWRYNLSLIER